MVSDELLFCEGRGWRMLKRKGPGMPYKIRPNEIALKSRVGRLASCRNNLRHGATAKTVFLPGEKPEKFFVLLHNLFEFYAPSTEPDAELVADLVLARWFFLRRQSAYLAHKSALFAQKPDCGVWTADDQHQLKLLRTYKNESERAIRRTRGRLEPMRLAPTRGRRWRYLHELQKKRFELETW
jgi:hypothetical protein